MKCIYRAVVMLLLLFFVFSGCTPVPVSEKNNLNTSQTATSVEEKEEAPKIPPMETFMIPFEIFDEGMKSANGIGIGGIFLSAAPRASFGTRSNWNHAIFNVGFWNTVVKISLAIPVVAFAASFQNIPLKQPDGSWLWSYDVRIDETIYSAMLYGKYIEQGVRWEMYITRENGFQDFLWYYGENNRSYTEGFWVLKNNPSDQDDLIRIDWSKDAGDDTLFIRYTNVLLNSPENGGYIDVKHTGSSNFDYIWDIFNKGRNNHTIIEWSSLTKEGRVKDPARFSDEEWHCWDENKLNVQCP